MPITTVYGLAALWILWIVPVFVLRVRSKGTRRAKTAKSSLMWMLLQAASYPLAFAAPSLGRVTWWRIVLAAIVGLVSLALMWTAIPALGKQWRLAAGVNEDHQLVQTGPYAIVRHPIYASMFTLLLATGLILSPGLLLAIASATFLIGTAGRVRLEDQILAEHFGQEFERYRSHVPALVPGLGKLPG